MKNSKGWRKWNKQVFGNLDTKIHAFKKELRKLDILGEERTLTEVEVASFNALKYQLWASLQLKEQYWAQMARTNALKGKDKNTKYFHTIAAFKKIKNCIKSLKGEKGLVTNPRGIKKEIINFFKNLYSEDKSVCLKLLSYDGNRLSPIQAQSLEVLPTTDEIKNVVWAWESSKSPVYDRFNFGFLKNIWNTVAEDLSKAVYSFFENGTLPESINTTWVTLIPKFEGDSKLFKYRPISMVECVFKEISKIMASRLRNVLPSLIGETKRLLWQEEKS